MRLLKQALAYAEQGIPVFPCIENGKVPAVPGGFLSATTDVDQINRWWYINPRYNIGVVPDSMGCVVVDVDPSGLDEMQAMMSRGELPPTYTVGTPRGGYHFYYTGSGPCSASKIAAGIDTRGHGGDVLVPPSVVDGKKYEVTNGIPCATLPRVLHERMSSPALRVQSVGGPGDERTFDTDANEIRGRARLHACVAIGDIAVSGSGGNDRTYRAATELLNLGLSPEKSWELLNEIWNPNCQPPWEDDELAEIVSNAAKYAQNEPGAWAVRPTEATFRRRNRARVDLLRLARYDRECRAAAQRFLQVSDRRRDGSAPGSGVALAERLTGAKYDALRGRMGDI